MLEHWSISNDTMFKQENPAIGFAGLRPLPVSQNRRVPFKHLMPPPTLPISQSSFTKSKHPPIPPLDLSMCALGEDGPTLREVPASILRRDVGIIRGIADAFSRGGPDMHRFVHMYYLATSPDTNAAKWDLPDGMAFPDPMALPIHSIISKLIKYKPPTESVSSGDGRWATSRDPALPEKWRHSVGAFLLLVSESLESLSEPAKARISIHGVILGDIVREWESEGIRRVSESLGIIAPRQGHL